MRHQHAKYETTHFLFKGIHSLTSSDLIGPLTSTKGNFQPVRSGSVKWKLQLRLQQNVEPIRMLS